MTESIDLGRQGRARGRARAGAQGRQPPPHWRLEAIAATPRPRSLTVGADRRRASSSRTEATPPTSGCSTSRARRARAADHRPRAGAVLGGHPAAPVARRRDRRLRRRGPRVARADRRRPAAQARRGRRARCGSTTRAWSIAVERDDDGTTRLAVVDVADPWPRRLAIGTATSTPTATRARPPSRPTRREVAYAFTPRDDLNRCEIRVVALDGGAVRALTGTPRMHDTAPPGRRTARRSPTPRSAAAATRSTSSGATARRPPAHAATTPTSPSSRGTRTATRLLAVRGRRNRFDLVIVDAATRRRPRSSPGRDLGLPALDAPAGAIVATYEDHATPPELRLAGAGRAAHAPAPARARSRARRTSRSRRCRSRSFDGLEIPAFLLPPARRLGRAPVPAVVYPHGGPTDAYGDDWDGHAQYFVDKGYAWLAPNFRGSTGYGRDFERAQPRRVGRRRHQGLPRRGRLPAHARLGRRRPPRDLRRQLRLVHGAAGGDRRPRAPLPLRGVQVRRLRHRHLVGAGRSRRRAGPRADDGPALDRARGVPRRLALPPARERRTRRCSSPTASATSA